MNDIDRFKKIRDLLNEILEDGDRDVGFHAPGTLDVDPFVKILLGKYNSDHTDVEVLSHLSYDSGSEKWVFNEGDFE